MCVKDVRSRVIKQEAEFIIDRGKNEIIEIRKSASTTNMHTEKQNRNDYYALSSMISYVHNILYRL